MKVLTVLVPTYNVEKYLRRCLDSLLLPEVLEEIEVLVVNDGSKARLTLQERMRKNIRRQLSL
jgi:glycosyltransferase involved in cell wall biosynthesis